MSLFLLAVFIFAQPTGQNRLKIGPKTVRQKKTNFRPEPINYIEVQNCTYVRPKMIGGYFWRK